MEAFLLNSLLKSMEQHVDYQTYSCAEKGTHCTQRVELLLLLIV